MEVFLLILVVAAPAIWFGLLLVPTEWANRRAGQWGRGMEKVSMLAGISSLAMASAILMQGSQTSLRVGGITLIYLDVLSVGMAVLIALIGWVIVRYSRTYLAGDARQGVFFQWLGATLGSVSLLVVAGNFLVLLAAWISTSLCLHYLLTFYAERPGAVLSARKKFLFSRAADLFLIGATILLHRTFGTLELPALLEKARAMIPADASLALNLGILALACGAILKSAQFPFHTWLPDTLETPTPVSALMHAGIISAGGFLLIRMSPVVVLAPHVLNLLALVGAVTAIFGSLVMLTQTSIKKALAFSTVAQMGYMVMECGLGLFGLAALHLVAHSFYKAHAFLSSGSTISQAAPVPFSSRASGSGFFGAGWVVLSLVLCAALGWLFGLSLDREPGILVTGGILAMSMATLWWTSRPDHNGWRAIIAGGGICALYFLLHHVSTWSMAGTVPISRPATGPLDYLVMAAILTGFLVVFLLQTSLAGLQSRGWGQKLYVLIFNRFYVNALVNRLVLKIWPPALRNPSQS